MAALDPTVGGILGDGTLLARRLRCLATRQTHSDPQGLVDAEPTIHDRYDLSFEFARADGAWEPARFLLHRSTYFSEHFELRHAGPIGADPSTPKRSSMSKTIRAHGSSPLFAARSSRWP